MDHICSCGARLARLRKVIGRLRRRLARLHFRRRRPAPRLSEEAVRQIQLHEAKLRESAEAGYRTLARLAEGERRRERIRGEEAA